MDAKSKQSNSFLALAMPAVDVGFALPSSSRGKVFIPPLAMAVVRQEKVGLACLQECGIVNRGGGFA